MMPVTSVKVNIWARNKFDLWRVSKGMSTERKLGEILYPEVGALLVKFFLMCCKCNGERNPSASLMSIFMAFQRMLCKEQEKRVKHLCVSK